MILLKSRWSKFKKLEIKVLKNKQNLIHLVFAAYLFGETFVYTNSTFISQTYFRIFPLNSLNAIEIPWLN